MNLGAQWEGAGRPMEWVLLQERSEQAGRDKGRR